MTPFTYFLGNICLSLAENMLSAPFPTAYVGNVSGRSNSQTYVLTPEKYENVQQT